jgi:hypothetical protein
MGEAVGASGEESIDMVVPLMKVCNFNFTETAKFYPRSPRGINWSDSEFRSHIMASKRWLNSAIRKRTSYPLSGTIYSHLSL